MRPKTLLIDDEEDFVRLLAERLQARDFPVGLAFTAQEGLSQVERESPLVVVLDVNLPDKSGLEVLREIKSRWPLIQVVMLTGLSDVPTAVAGMRLGAADYLVKPVDVAVLVEALERATRRRLDEEEGLRMIETGKLAVLGKLAEGVAHEISNPVAIILQKAGWARELLEVAPGQTGPDVGEARRELSGIEVQARRCRDIIAKLMNFCGRIDPRPSVFSLDQVLEAVLAGYREEAGRLGITLEVRAQPGLPELCLARAELEQVLRQLVENAFEAMSPGGGELVLSTRRAGDHLELTVADSGPGIAPAVLPHMFDPFFSTKQVGQGSGLGLAICHGILKSMGGDIRAENRPQGGASFSITLPLS
jgi:signal transduction histidine kinase